MNRWAWTAVLAMIVLAGLGCRGASSNAARGFDANRDAVGSPAMPLPDKNLLADQTEISRRVREARAAPTRPPVPTPGPEANAASVAATNAPKDVLAALSRALAAGDKAAFLASTNAEPADGEFFGAMLDMMTGTTALRKDVEKAYGKDVARAILAPGPTDILTDENLPKFQIQETGDRAVATLRRDEGGGVTSDSSHNLVRKGGKWVMDVTGGVPAADKRPAALQAIQEFLQTLAGLKSRVGKDGETGEKIAEEWQAGMTKLAAAMEPGPGPGTPSGPGPVPGPERATAPPPDATVAAAVPADAQTAEAVKAAAAVIQNGARRRADASFSDFLVDADVASAKAIADSAKKCQQKIKDLTALGQSKLQTDLGEFLDMSAPGRPEPWLPALTWSYRPPEQIQVQKVGDKAQVAMPFPGPAPATLVQVDGKWKIEYTQAQRDSLKLLQEYYDAQAQYLDAVSAGVNSGDITRDNCRDKIAQECAKTLLPVLTKIQANAELASPGGPGWAG